jgi:uncharacterized protein (DUF2147 family)
MSPIATRLPTGDPRTFANARSLWSWDTASGQRFNPDRQRKKTSMRASVGLLISRGGATVVALALLASPLSAAETASPVGTWVTASGHGVVEIASCGSALCGRIVGIERGPTDVIPTDSHGRSQCGLTILSDEKPDTDGSWLGVVTDPRDGGTYQAKLWMDPRGDLKLRGFIGIPQLGSTQTWHKFSGHLTAGCRLI